MDVNGADKRGGDGRLKNVYDWWSVAKFWEGARGLFFAQQFFAGIFINFNKKQLKDFSS